MCNSFFPINYSCLHNKETPYVYMLFCSVFAEEMQFLNVALFVHFFADIQTHLLFFIKKKYNKIIYTQNFRSLFQTTCRKGCYCYCMSFLLTAIRLFNCSQWLCNILPFTTKTKSLLTKYIMWVSGVIVLLKLLLFLLHVFHKYVLTITLTALHTKLALCCCFKIWISWQWHL